MRRRVLLLLITALLTAGTLTGLAHAAGASGRGDQKEIDINNFSYFPNAATVAPGTIISVRNGDFLRMHEAHTLTANTGEFDTGIIRDVPVQFRAPRTPGVYAYHCEIHPFMKGSLTVSG